MEVPNTFLDLFLGYTVIWAILAVFVFRLVNSQARLRREIASLSEQVELCRESTAGQSRAAK